MVLPQHFFFPLLHSGSPSLHNPGFQSKKNLPQLDEALVFHLLHHPNFPTLTSHPPKKKPTTLWNKPQCDRFLKTKNPRLTTTGHRPGMIDRSSPNGTGGRWSSGSAVLLCGASVLWFQFSYGNHHCASHRNMYHMGFGSSGDVFLFGKTLFLVVGLAVFVFDTYFSYIISSYIMYHIIISSYIKSHIVCHMSIITYNISYIIYH